MRIAGSIILGVIGAILYFAVTVDVAGVSLPTVGIILMVGAAVWFLLELVVALTGGRSPSTSPARGDDGTVQQQGTTSRRTRVNEDR